MGQKPEMSCPTEIFIERYLHDIIVEVTGSQPSNSAPSAPTEPAPSATRARRLARKAQLARQHRQKKKHELKGLLEVNQELRANFIASSRRLSAHGSALSDALDACGEPDPEEVLERVGSVPAPATSEETPESRSSRDRSDRRLARAATLSSSSAAASASAGASGFHTPSLEPATPPLEGTTPSSGRSHARSASPSTASVAARSGSSTPKADDATLLQVVEAISGHLERACEPAHLAGIHPDDLAAIQVGLLEVSTAALEQIKCRARFDDEPSGPPASSWAPVEPEVPPMNAPEGRSSPHARRPGSRLTSAAKRRRTAPQAPAAQATAPTPTRGGASSDAGARHDGSRSVHNDDLPTLSPPR